MVCCHPIEIVLDVRLVDAPSAGVTQEEDHTGSLHLPSAVLALFFFASRIHPSLSLVDRSPLVLHDVRKNRSSYDCAEIRTHVPTSEGFEVSS